MFKWFRFIFIALIIAVGFYSTNAYASSETLQYPSRGEGAAEISGYIITDVQYHLSKNPSKLGSVEFNLDGPASQVVIGFDIPADQLFTCRNVRGQHWFCEVHEVEIALIKEFRVIASG